MHICPQEIIAAMTAITAIRPAIGLVKYWCASCFDGTHTSCEDHAEDVASASIEVVSE